MDSHLKRIFHPLRRNDRNQDMNFSNVISSVEAHAAGCPLRVITGGFPVIPGNTVVEKTQYLRDEMDHLRTAVLFEPRGHSGMCATVITESSAPRADVGMLILEPQGYVPMCGHCTIATCTVLVETGMVQVEEPVTKINLETLAGLIEARVSVENGRARSVTIRNVPAFLYEKSVKLQTKEFGEIVADLAYGGMYYLLVPAESAGLTLQQGELDKIITAGISIRDDALQQLNITHPGLDDREQAHYGGTMQVQFYGPPPPPRGPLQERRRYPSQQHRPVPMRHRHLLPARNPLRRWEDRHG